MKQISASHGLDAYKAILKHFQPVKKRHNHNFEIEDLVLDFPCKFNATGSLKSYIDYILKIEPTRLAKGLLKAERAYVRKGDRITKPSYISRIRAFPDFSKRTRLITEIDQIRSVARGLCKEPNASYHVISIFRPVDLLEKFRPGYVPCVVCADFKFRDNKLSGKFFFRSCDAYNLLPFDIFYCVGILQQLLDQILSNGFSQKIEMGSALFWFSRIYVSRFDIDKCQPMIDLIEKFESGAGDPDYEVRPSIMLKKSPQYINVTNEDGR